MPVAKGQPLDPRVTRERVLRTASRLFNRSSLHAVGVNEIAASAGASKLSLYRYFGSKQQLAVEVAAARSRKVHRWLRAETESAEPGLDRVLAVFDLLVSWYAEPDYQGCAILNAVIDTRGESDEVRDVGRNHLNEYRGLLEERLREAGFAAAQARRLAGQLLLLIEGATAVSTIEGSRSRAGRDARSAAEALLRAAGVTG